MKTVVLFQTNLDFVFSGMILGSEFGFVGKEYFEVNYVDPNRAFGGGSVMVWGGISIKCRTDQVIFPPLELTTVRYVNEVLCPHLIRMQRRMGRDFILMQYNVCPHVAARD